MRIASVLFGLVAIVGLAAAAPAADHSVIQALTAKAADVHDYHYRLEWELVGGVPFYNVEVWYAGPDRMRIAMGFGDRGRPLMESIIRGGEAYSLNHQLCEVTKSDVSEHQRPPFESQGETLGRVFLTPEVLGLRPRVEAKGTEAVGGALCRIVDVADPGSALSGNLEQDDNDFVAFVPSGGQSGGLRLWVDSNNGMVWRSGRITRGRVQQAMEVTETRQVNGFQFPSVVKRPEGGLEMTGRVTEAQVNQGVEKAFGDLPLPPNWLMRDQTLTLDQVREQLKAHPDDASLHYALGQLYQAGNQRNDAAQEFRRAAELALAQAVGRGGDRDREAADALRRAAELAGESAWLVRMQLAEMLDRAGPPEEAVAAYREMMAVGPPLSYWGAGELAGALAKQGDYEGAYRTMAEVPMAMLSVFGSNTESLVEWATKSNHLEDLRARAERALAQEAGLAQARLLLVRVLQAQGHQAEAVKALKAIPATLAPSEWQAMSELVALADGLGEKEFADHMRRAAIRQAIESGYPWLASRLFPDRGLTDTAAGELIQEGAALWSDAADAQSRDGILDAMSNVMRSLGGGDGGPVPALARKPEEMTPAECAIAGVLATAVADRGQEGEETTQARRQAEAYLERALTEWPDDAALWAAVGKLHWSAQAWGDAADAYGKAAAFDPREIEYPARAAFALARLKQYDRALETGRKAIEPWPGEWPAKAFVASLEMDCGQLEPAREALAAVYASSEVQTSLQRDTVGRLLARCYEQTGELDQAETVLKEEVANAEQWRQTEAYQRLIQFYARHQRRGDVYATAKELYAGARDNSWEQQLAVNEMQSAFGHDEEGQAALAAQVQADLAAHAGDAGTIRFAAAAYEAMGGIEKALPLLRKAAEEANDADVWVQLAEVAQRAGDGGLVATALGRATALRPDDHELRVRYARAAAAQGDVAAAKALADELRGKAGDSGETWREVAELYLTAQSWEDALAAAKQVLALAPQDDESAQMRAEVLIARAYAGKRDDHEARRRLIPILARATDPEILREAAQALVDLYLLRNERDQAIATLNDLRLRTQDSGLRNWVDQQLKEIAGPEPPRP
jgi:predicted TPR repeat methyltransferase